MPQKAPTWLLVLGWITAILGGLLGIAMGAILRFSKAADASGNKVPRYDDSSRQQGLYMMILGVVMLVVWNLVAAGMR